MENNNHITIDDLVVMVQKGFLGVENKMDERFKKVDERFDKVEKRLDIIEDKVDNLDIRLEKIEKGILVDHKQRIEKLEVDVFNLQTAVAGK